MWGMSHRAPMPPPLPKKTVFEACGPHEGGGGVVHLGHWPAPADPPPTHIKEIFLCGKMKFTEEARIWRLS